MSLQLAAQHMASRGRGPDTQLVHMAPQEVAGLQALAKAHGGSLSVNPETGLAEAGFLSSILPTVLSNSAFPVADTPRYGDMSQNFGREQSYFPQAGSATGVYNPQTGEFSGGSAGASDFVYDPATQTYRKRESQAEKLVRGDTGAMQSSGDSGGGGADFSGGTPGASPLSGLQIDFTGPNFSAAKTGLMLGGIPGALIGGILGGLNVQTTTPATGPGTIGSRDTRGSNESALADLVALAAENNAAMGYGTPASLGYSAAEVSAMNDADQQGSMGYGGSAPSAPSVGTGMGYNSDYASPSSGDSGGGWGGDSGGMFGGAQSGDVGFAYGGITSLAGGGAAQYNLGGYSDGGRLLRGPGDGVSDDIPATIGEKQPARLADGEFILPARIVSELGNGSTEAGARKLYAMMDRVQKARKKSIGKDKVATDSKASRLLPA